MEIYEFAFLEEVQKIAENQEYEVDDTPNMDDNEEDKESKEEEKEPSIMNLTKRRLLKKSKNKLLKKKKREKIPKKEDINAIAKIEEDDPEQEQRMADKTIV